MVATVGVGDGRTDGIGFGVGEGAGVGDAFEAGDVGEGWELLVPAGVWVLPLEFREKLRDDVFGAAMPENAQYTIPPMIRHPTRITINADRVIPCNTPDKRTMIQPCYICYIFTSSESQGGIQHIHLL